MFYGPFVCRPSVLGREHAEWHNVFKLVAREIDKFDLLHRLASMLDYSDGIEQEAQDLVSKPGISTSEATFKLLKFWFEK